MIKIIVLSVLFFFFQSCNDDIEYEKPVIYMMLTKQNNKEQMAKTKYAQNALQNKLDISPVCDMISKDYLLDLFPKASNFKPFSREKPYPSCSYRFKYNDKNYKVGLTLVKKYASEKNLDKAVSYFKEKEELKGIGEKAYYIPTSGQVSLYNANYLAHVYVTINEIGNKELALKITKHILNKLN